MNQRVSWVETVLSYDDDDGFFLLRYVPLVAELYRVHQCKLLERMLWQILRERQVHFVHVVDVCLILLLVE